MRTTLDIDDDLLLAARELAHREKKTAGEVISELLRDAMTRPRQGSSTAVREPEAHNGFAPFAPRGTVVSEELVQRLRNDVGP